MHEVSLNQVITDYLTGENIELTTYEDLRQSLAALMVEEKGYPKTAIVPKYKLNLTLGSDHYVVCLDFVIHIDDNPALLIGFCPGAVSTFITQFVCAARIFNGKPIPYVIVTDCKDAALIRTADKKDLCRGYHCIPDWGKLQALYKEAPAFELTESRKNKESRIVYAMFALSDSCCTDQCMS